MKNMFRCFLVLIFYACFLSFSYAQLTIESIHSIKIDNDRNFIPDRLGEFVRTTGVVSVVPNSLSMIHNYTYIQDSNSGIMLFADSSKFDLNVGDSIIAEGTLAIYRGMTYLKNPSANIISSSNRIIPLPLENNINKVFLERYESKLVTITGEITDIKENKGGDILELRPLKYSELTVQIFCSHYHKIPSLLKNCSIGDNIIVTGILGQYDYSNQDSFYEIYPRKASDIQILPRSILISHMEEVLAFTIIFTILICLGFITKLIIEKKKIKESENNFRILAKTVPSAIIIYDESAIYYANEFCEILTGYSVNQLIEEHNFASLLDQEKKNLYNFFTTLRDRQTHTLRFSTNIQCANSQKKWVQISSSILKVKRKTLFISTLLDVSNSRDTVLELVKANNKALESEKLKTEFLAQMSHEIRSPLSAILSHISLIEMETKNMLSEDLCECFASITKSSQRLTRTIDQILLISEFETNSYYPNFLEINFKQNVLDTIISEYCNVAKQKGLEFEVSTEVEEFFVYSDSYSLYQAISNLVDNAIKYTLSGGIFLRLFKSGSFISLSIKDTGIGISKDFMPKLFEKFTQEEQGYTRRFDGNGLGMSLVKKYCDLNGINIQVESEKMVGTEFILKFDPKNVTSVIERKILAG